MIDCQFLEPIDLGEGDFEYSQMNCSSTYLELIQNSNTGAEFFISKTATYGDVILFWFLTLFLIFFIVKSIAGFFWR